LAISQSIVEQHHGGITVKSAVGKGSTFTLRLPRFAGGGRGVADV
jgi:signal transduction histidine kinase